MKSVAVLDCTEIPNEVVNFVSQKAGLEYIDTLLSKRNVTYVISVIAKDRLKIVGRSIEECSNLKSCLCENISKVSVHLPDENEHIFFSSQWHEILKSLEAESLVEYKVESDKSLRRSVIIFGVKELVVKYATKLKDLMHSLKIVCNKMVLAPSISRFMKEVMESEIHALEADFKKENVKIEIRDCECEIKGTEQGIVKVRAKFEELKSKIMFELKEFSSLGLGKLLSSENGKLILKGIETENNVVIEILNGFGSSADVMNFTRETAGLVDNEPFNVCNFKTTEGINVSWKYGNIERERADVLVNSATSNLNTPSMIGKAMNTFGGSLYVSECSNFTNVAYGDVVTTSGGNLRCKYVVHAVCCDWQNEERCKQFLKDLIIKILIECEKCSAKSVAMPLIGAGKHKFPEDVVLHKMKEAVILFSSTFKRNSLQEIRLIRFEGKKSNDQVMSHMDRQNTKRKHKRNVLRKTIPTPYPMVLSEDSEETLKFQFYAQSLNDISAAVSKIENFIQLHITSKTIENEKLRDVVDGNLNEFKRLAIVNGVKIVCECAESLSIEGRLEDVVETKEKVFELINEYADYADQEHRSREIERLFPIEWETQHEDLQVKLVRLSTHSSEYLKVLNHFVENGGEQDDLRRVERVQNPRLYSLYMTSKKSGIGNEKWLFHGTDEANINSINAHNFSRSFAGVNGQPILS
ncbi:protein mono-ADP-ribosyltransferase PARP14-like isoform X2 [Xenia sp. Carnegie-2017]|uniref:protein mono-ADP-ribosyltransferase PARP14-like isoform X2 n=1 Tax=Xenia sp. Carnegie-2017 TaxID=2897299 RepID=UPI001F0429BE|nr:protein mono-ADP-ribosyltransferase PARP14-like isoform X2 [Xenia sp. Carnegie-2017]XP_046851439.1 protein mono-ADP-ribosyltransferase PARP14-like isoform X2 [Xenia sp. Carnegie-2017]